MKPLALLRPVRLLAAIAAAAILTGCAGTKATSTEFRTQANFAYCKWTGGANPTLEMRDVNHSTPTRAGAEYVNALGGLMVPIVTGATGGGTVGAASVAVPVFDSFMRRR